MGVLLLLILTLLTYAQSHPDVPNSILCWTPDNKQGTCLRFTQCEYLRKQNPAVNFISRLIETSQQSSVCNSSPSGYPRVCCPYSNTEAPIYYPGSGQSSRTRIGEYQTWPGHHAFHQGPYFASHPASGAYPGLQGFIPYPSYPSVHSQIVSTKPIAIYTSPPPLTSLTSIPFIPDLETENISPGTILDPNRMGRVIKRHPNVELLPIDDCGFDTAAIRIIGGNHTDVDQYPWTALLEYEKKNGKRHFGCGGVLISKRYVLTAAHCTSMHLKHQRLVNIRLGEHDIDSVRDGCDSIGEDCADPPLNIGIEKEIPHPEFKSKQNRKNMYNDIALVRLQSDVPNINSDYVRTICIPIETEVLSKSYDNRFLIVTGWGQTGDGTRKLSPIKKHVKLRIVNNAKCSADYTRLKERPIIDSQICAGGNQFEDSCKGDSGGPLMSTDKTFRDDKVHYHVTGIVSFGLSCTNKEQSYSWVPGVYTRVAKYSNWILDQLRP